MFTGIVEEIGKVAGIVRKRDGAALVIDTEIVCSDAKLGDSIAVDGVCLSVVDIKGRLLSFDVIKETLRRTSLGDLKRGDGVNLERSLRSDSRIGGHFVSGHIDYKGAIEQILKGKDGAGFAISLPLEFAKFVAEKGSVAVDGVSLTVAKVDRQTFTVYLIPHPLEVTTLGKKKNGCRVNVETDLLAKYISRQASKTDIKTLLKKYDYI